MAVGNPARQSSRAARADGAAITSYPAALQFLSDHVDVERLRVIRCVESTFKLDRTRDLLKALGDPHNEIRCVHVAGTKGKGSTTAMLAAGLRGCGLTVGEYTSPHLVDVRERIRIDGRMTSQDEFTRHLREVAKAEASLGGEPLHFFELLTAAAFLHFAEQAVDLAVIEVGLGGRLDATNVINPEVSVITQISLDHMDLLGSTLDKIAREKAGILKRGAPAVTTPQEPEVESVLRAAADDRPTELRFLDREIEFSSRFQTTGDLGPHMRICLTTPDSIFEHVPVPLRGEHQALNCGLALGAADCLRRRGHSLPEELFAAGLAATRLEGRMEMVCTNPRVIIDGAHNAASIKALVRSLGAYIPYDSLVVIFGCGADKDVDGMLRAIALGADKLIFTRTHASPRALEPEDLQHRFAELSGKMTQTAPGLQEAMELADRAVGREDLICITGSFYLVGEAKKLLAGGWKRGQAGRRSTSPDDSSTSAAPRAPEVIVRPRSATLGSSRRREDRSAGNTGSGRTAGRL